MSVVRDLPCALNQFVDGFSIASSRAIFDLLFDRTQFSAALLVPQRSCHESASLARAMGRFSLARSCNSHGKQIANGSLAAQAGLAAASTVEPNSKASSNMAALRKLVRQAPL